MSVEMGSERVCYVQCNYCNTILAVRKRVHDRPPEKVREHYKVSVPGSSLFTMVTVRCGHCANLLSVNLGGLLQSVYLQDFQKQQSMSEAETETESGSSSKGNPQQQQPKMPIMPPIRPPEKRQRVPSAYNRFIKEEIQRIKASNPEITHRQAFSAAAKNWAHLPHIHFGLNKQPIR